MVRTVQVRLGRINQGDLFLLLFKRNTVSWLVLTSECVGWVYFVEVGRDAEVVCV